VQVLVTRTKSFHQDSEVLTIGPTKAPRTVPDWIRDTETFRQGARDGSIIELQVLTPNVVEVPVKPTAVPPELQSAETAPPVQPARKGNGK
jgi:hypothetical protein